MNDRELLTKTLQEQWEQWRRDLRKVLAREMPSLFGEPEQPKVAEPEEPKIRTEPPEKPAQYVESQERQARQRVQSFEGQAGSASVPVVDEMGMATDQVQRRRGIWLGGEFVYLDPDVGLQARPVDQVQAFVPDSVQQVEPEEESAPLPTPGLMGFATVDGERVNGIWRADLHDNLMFEWADVDRPGVSGSAPYPYVRDFEPIVAWDDELTQDIAEDICSVLANHDVSVSEHLSADIFNAILFRRNES